MPLHTISYRYIPLHTNGYLPLPDLPVVLVANGLADESALAAVDLVEEREQRAEDHKEDDETQSIRLCNGM